MFMLPSMEEMDIFAAEAKCQKALGDLMAKGFDADTHLFARISSKGSANVITEEEFNKIIKSWQTEL